MIRFYHFSSNDTDRQCITVNILVKNPRKGGKKCLLVIYLFIFWRALRISAILISITQNYQHILVKEPWFYFPKGEYTAHDYFLKPELPKN